MSPVVLLLVLIFRTGRCWEEPHCTGVDVARCVSPLSHYLNKTNDLLFPNYELSTMRTLCRDYQQANRCLHDLKYHCKYVMQTVMTGIENSYSYICSSSGIRGYENNEDCLARPVLQGEGRRCVSEFVLKNTHVAITKALGGTTYKEEFCRVANSYLDCLHDVIEKECGRDAAYWQSTVIKDALRQVLALLDCRIVGEWTEGEIIFVSVMVGTILIISAAPVVMHVYTKITTGRPPNDAAATSGAGPAMSKLPGHKSEEGDMAGWDNPGYAYGGRDPRAGVLTL